MSMVRPGAGSRRRVMVNLGSVLCLASQEDWRLVTGRRMLRALSAGIPAAQAYIGKLLFDTLSAGYGSGDRHVWRTAIGYLLLLSGRAPHSLSSSLAMREENLCIRSL